MVRRVYRSGKWVTPDTPRAISFASYVTRCARCHAECIMTTDGIKPVLTNDGKKIHECGKIEVEDMFDAL